LHLGLLALLPLVTLILISNFVLFVILKTRSLMFLNHLMCAGIFILGLIGSIFFLALLCISIKIIDINFVKGRFALVIDKKNETKRLKNLKIQDSYVIKKISNQFQFVQESA